MKNIKSYLLVLLSISWITINVYFLPFFAWTTGVVLGWMMQQGLFPYRDLVWNRTPLDLFFLADWFKVFGSSQISYQSFIYFIFILITALVFKLSYQMNQKAQIPTLIFYTIFMFPLFQNTESDEMIIGLIPLILLAVFYKYLDKRKLWTLFLTAAVTALCIATKQTTGGIGIAIVATLAIDSYIKKDVSLFFKSLAVFSAGIIISSTIFIIWLVANGAWPDFLWGVISLTTTYVENPVPPGFSLGSGLWIEAAYFSLIIPFVLYWKETKLSFQKVAFISLLIICLAPTIMPGLLSYRAFPGFPLASLIAGVNIVILLNKKTKIMKKFAIATSFIIFIILTFNFWNPYLSQFEEGLHFKNYIVDYSENDYKVADWIKKNTAKGERIMTMTNWVVYMLSDRMPKNKYLSFEPLLLLPYDVSSKTFISDPPRVFVMQSEVLETRPDIKPWPFFAYVKKHYESVAKYGTSEIFVLKK